MTIEIQHTNKLKHTERTGGSIHLIQGHEFELSNMIAEKQEDVFEKIMFVPYKIDYQHILPSHFQALKDSFVRRIPETYSDVALLPFIGNKLNANNVTINQILLSLTLHDKIKEIENCLSIDQFKMVAQVIDELSKNDSILFLKPVFEYSVDDEVCVIRGANNGNHYIIIGSGTNELSYGFVGKQKGEYDSLHANFDTIGVSEIVEAFINR
jgi:hypothetical protein